MVRCVTTHSTRSTHRQPPVPYWQGVATRFSHPSSCQTDFRATARNATRKAWRSAARMRVAFRTHGALPRYAFEFGRHYAQIACQGRPCWAREDSCLMSREGLSHETQGARHRDITTATCNASARACVCTRDACSASGLHLQAQAHSTTVP